jgi:hypothetical protein
MVLTIVLRAVLRGSRGNQPAADGVMGLDLDLAHGRGEGRICTVLLAPAYVQLDDRTFAWALPVTAAPVVVVNPRFRGTVDKSLSIVCGSVSDRMSI